jgi:hypothetical protein
MKNVLLKKHLMNNSTSANGKTVIGLDELSLSYDYQFSKSITEQRGQYNNYCSNKNYLNKSFKSFDLVHLSYKTIEFNMITCPTNLGINIQSWGLDWGSRESKKHFMLGETEVTQELFEAVMGFNYSNFKEYNKNPVENITWFDCLDFCNRLSDYFSLDHCYLLRDKDFTNSNYPLSIENAEITFIEGTSGFRLPKEWEWQIAAMAGTGNKYAGTNDDESLKRVAWFRDNSGEKTHPVAQKMPNEWGFYDMSGNVTEWCENSHDLDENKDSSAKRVCRGGGWSDYDSFLCTERTGVQSKFSSSERYNNLGFRVARSI